jgi:hypothetical protein
VYNIRRFIVLAVLVALVLTLLFLPVRIPFDLVSVGVATPLEEWKLVQDANGGLLANHLQFRTGITQGVAAWQFRGGDISGMSLAIPSDSSVWVDEGDTLVRMYSAQVQEQILDLENSLEYQRAQFQNLNTGEKPPTVHQAEAQLKYAQEQLDFAEKQYILKAPLYKEGLIALLEFQECENLLQLAKTAVQTAKKQLEVVATGEKPELLGVTTTEIGNLERRLDFLKKRNASYIVRAPFSGRTTPVAPYSGDLLILQNFDLYLVNIPVKTRDLRWIGDSTRIEIVDPATGDKINAQLLEKGSKSEVLDNQAVNFLLAAVRLPRDKKLNLGPGTQCIVHCDELSPLDYLKRILNSPVSTQ